MEQALVFPTTHYMLTAETLLERMGLSFRLVPAPREAGQVCSTAIAVPSTETARATEALEAEGVPVTSVLPYHGWREHGIRRIADGFFEAARPYAGLSASLEKVAAGERLSSDDIAGLLALEDEAGRIMQAFADELGRYFSGNRAVGLARISIGKSLDLSPLKKLITEMRETGHTHLLLDMEGEGELAVSPDSFRAVIGEDVIPIVRAASSPRKAGELVSEYGIRQVLVGTGRAFQLSDREIAEEIAFLEENIHGPVGSGNLLPLLHDDWPAAEKEARDKLDKVTAACRLALIDVHLPTLPRYWISGMPAGADMPVLEALSRSFRETSAEVEEVLKWHGWEFARGRR